MAAVRICYLDISLMAIDNGGTKIWCNMAGRLIIKCTLILCMIIISTPVVRNMATMRNFWVISDKSNVY